MGEFSKRIGEIGENVVGDFLTLIGWTGTQNNFDIPSSDPEKHGKKTNGIDKYFHYESSMISNTIENIIISSKYSTVKYPNNPVSEFKSHYYDLAKAIESFKVSEIKHKTISTHELVEQHFDRGVLFWLNNASDTENDLISKLTNIDLDKGWLHDGIFLVDNKRIYFISDSITYPKVKFKTAVEIDFIYFSSGQNNNDTTLKNGKILPVQSINASILPLRVFDKEKNETTVIITCIDDFEEETLMKLMGLAKNIGCNVQVNTIICFPNYQESAHEQSVNSVKQVYNDPSFTDRLIVDNYNNPILK